MATTGPATSAAQSRYPERERKQASHFHMVPIKLACERPAQTAAPAAGISDAHGDDAASPAAATLGAKEPKKRAAEDEKETPNKVPATAAKEVRVWLDTIGLGAYADQIIELGLDTLDILQTHVNDLESFCGPFIAKPFHLKHLITEAGKLRAPISESAPAATAPSPAVATDLAAASGLASPPIVTPLAGGSTPSVASSMPSTASHAPSSSAPKYKVDFSKVRRETRPAPPICCSRDA